MKKQLKITLLWVVYLLVAVAVVFVAPPLISSKNTVGVLSGFGIMLGFVIGSINIIVYLISTKEE